MVDLHILSNPVTDIWKCPKRGLKIRPDQVRRPRNYIIDHVNCSIKYWLILADFGEVWEVWADFGKCWPILADFCQSLPIMAHFWPILVDFGQFWLILRKFG